MPFAASDHYQIHYQCQGSGPAVVLLHSFLCDGEMWAEQVAALAKDYRVINIDIRGHGKSGVADKPLDIYDLVQDVVAVLDQEGVTTAHWAGLSIGGMIALRAAITVPERVSSLLLLDTHAGTETRFKVAKYKMLVGLAKLFGIRPLLNVVAKLMFGRHTRAHRPELVAYWKEKFAAMPLVSIQHMVNALCARDSLKARLPQIQQPAMVIVGEEDVSLPPPCSEALANRLANAELEVIKHAGHLSSLEQPHDVNRVMLDFLATCANKAPADKVPSPSA
ncbi:alpha/beta fold hydrolase [Microbulbifer hydrolyticus]|uniref:Alpha/beta fold hydrolase n=1 Tax=Microbulbifer hydrolyticus TaxID=48074 RepID=A0A6P1TB69_9GAMM|nr:alpha/beta fold hydrolase [Microbulbifer hydrolyticus]MBB5210653.1 pimeloyl-ACP methyl ester carboxylesterase [Microbulbifer hydrolyticus]QHQ38886.1 alpha/beta fold hydrolase [Microbulbifer hydrolyticus]